MVDFPASHGLVIYVTGRFPILLVTPWARKQNIFGRLKQQLVLKFSSGVQFK